MIGMNTTSRIFQGATPELRPMPSGTETSMAKQKLPKEPCLVCGDRETDRAHIQSRGAGGTWESRNIIALCRRHHRDQHAWGWPAFLDAFPAVRTELELKGWVVQDKGYGVRRLVLK